MRKRGVLIIECVDRKDPGSEGMCLAHMLDLMRVERQYVEVRTKKQLMGLLRTSPYRVVHITTHGAVEERARSERFVGLVAGDGEVESSDLDKLQGKLKGCTIVTTACRSGDKKFVDAIKRTGCSYYIAPRGSPWPRNAIFFAHIFYHKLFVLKKSVRDILAEYDGRYRNPHEFVVVAVENYIQRMVK